MSAKKEVRIGVFIPSTVQLLDMSPIDIFYMCSPEYLTACNLPAPLIAQGIPSTIHYISTPETGTHLELTARVVIRVSKTILDREVQPGNLDILLIPGPDPSVVFGEEVLKFVRGHAEWKGEKGERTDVLSICTGVNVLAQGGAIKGRSASGPRAFVSAHRKQYPETTWVDDKRWVTDGNIWSSGELPILTRLLEPKCVEILWVGGWN